MSERIAVLGLGTMGARTAAAFAEAGHEVSGADPVEAARARAEAAGVRTSPDAAAAIAGARVVVLSVPKPEHVQSLADGPLRRAAPGTIVVDLSTIAPDTARSVSQDLASFGVTYLDSPVLGRPAGCGEWTLVVGGPEPAIDEVRALLEGTLARQVIRVGDVGAGSVVKLLNNLMFGAINAVTAEAVHVCEAAGIDPTIFVEAVIDSGAATVSNLFRDIAPRLVSGDDAPVFTLDLLAKDNRLARELAAAIGVATPIADAVVTLNQRAVDLGHGSRDSIAVACAYALDASS